MIAANRCTWWLINERDPIEGVVSHTPQDRRCPVTARPKGQEGAVFSLDKKLVSLSVLRIPPVPCQSGPSLRDSNLNTSTKNQGPSSTLEG